jgi:serine O-acetyltransferase
MPATETDPTSTLSFSELVFSDFERHRNGGRPPSWLQIIPRLLTLTGMIASIILRAQQCLFRAGHVRTAWSLRTVGVVLVGADFVPGMTIGTGLFLPHPVGIVIGNGLRVGNDVMLAQGVTAGVREDAPPDEQEYPTICDGANIWAHATIVGGIRIGEGAEVGANSLVVSDVPDHAVVVGVPARKIAETKRTEPAAEKLDSIAP